MFKMTNTGHHHRNVMGIAIVDSLLVAHRATGLYYCIYTGLMRYLYTIGKGEECI